MTSTAPEVQAEFERLKAAEQARLEREAEFDRRCSIGRIGGDRPVPTDEALMARAEREVAERRAFFATDKGQCLTRLLGWSRACHDDAGLDRLISAELESARSAYNRSYETNRAAIEAALERIESAAAAYRAASTFTTHERAA